MTTTIQVTLNIVIKSPDALDENSVKGAINEGMTAIAESERFTTISDCRHESASVTIVGLKIGKNEVNPETYGTADVPFGDCSGEA